MRGAGLRIAVAGCSGLTLLASSAVMAFGHYGSQISADKVVTETKLKSGKASFEIEGICSYDVNSVDCWDTERKPLSELANEMTAKFKEYRGLFWTFGAKNYLLVSKSVPNEKQPIFGIQTIESLGVSLTGVRLTPFSRTPAPVRNFYAFSADKARTTISAFVREDLPPKATVKVKPEKGAKATSNGISVEVVDITPGTSSYYTKYKLKMSGFGDMKGFVAGGQLEKPMNTKTGSFEYIAMQPSWNKDQLDLQSPVEMSIKNISVTFLNYRTIEIKGLPLAK